MFVKNFDSWNTYKLNYADLEFLKTKFQKYFNYSKNATIAT